MSNRRLNKYAFTVLPYVLINSPFEFGEFNLWPDTLENWENYTKIKRPNGLLNMYVDRKGSKLGNITIITSKRSYNYEKVSKLVSALFFPTSLRHYFRPYSDVFWFESYIVNSVDKNDSSHSRIDKFVNTLVASKDFKIYQPAEADIMKFEARTDESEYFNKLKRIFNQAKYRSLFKSLNFYFKTQYRNLSFFPEIQDIQNFCTAFQILFKVDQPTGIGEAIATKLYAHFSLAETIDRAKLRTWFISLYKLRNAYTHGQNIRPSQLLYNGQRHIDIARQIYCECVCKYLKPKKGLGYQILSMDRSLLIALFSSQKVFDDIVRILTPSWGESEYSVQNTLSYLNKCEENEIYELLALSYKFVLYINKRSITQINKKRVKSAMQTTLAIIGDLTIQYSDKKYSKEFNTEVLSKLKNINLHPKNSSEWKETYRALNNPHIEYTKVIGSFDDFQNATFKRELVFRGIIDISMISHVFTDLFEIHEGWY